MEFIVELRFEDKGYNALVHFMATFIAPTEAEAKLFYHELIEGFKRNGISIFHQAQYDRIDNNPQLRERKYEYYEFYQSRATAAIRIEQFYVEDPDQTKSLLGNLYDNFFSGKDSTAIIGRKYNIPVRIVDKETRNPIVDEFFYYNVEHLIPKE